MWVGRGGRLGRGGNVGMCVGRGGSVGRVARGGSVGMWVGRGGSDGRWAGRGGSVGRGGGFGMWVGRGGRVGSGGSDGRWERRFGRGGSVGSWVEKAGRGGSVTVWVEIVGRGGRVGKSSIIRAPSTEGKHIAVKQMKLMSFTGKSLRDRYIVTILIERWTGSVLCFELLRPLQADDGYAQSRKLIRARFGLRSVRVLWQAEYDCQGGWAVP